MNTTKSKFVSSNKDTNQTICWSMLSESQCEEIFLTAVELLERSGAEVDNKKARDILVKGGCWADGNMIRFPSARLEWALRTAPSRLTVCGRDGRRAVLMEAENVAFGPGWGAESVADLKSGEVRPLTLKDITDEIHIADQLKDVEFVSAWGVPSDVKGKHPSFAKLSALREVMLGTMKPVVQPACCVKMTEGAIEMAAAAVGGKDALMRDPYLILHADNSESRYHGESLLDVVMTAAEHGVPLVYSSSAVMGRTAPATPAGTLVVAAANFLVGLTLAQLVREGTPVIAGGKFSMWDTDNDLVPRGAPETSLIGAGFANLARWMRVPSFGVSGATDSQVSDTQTGVEVAQGLLTSALAGTNMISGGMMGGGLIASLPILAMSEEIMTQVYRIMRSFIVDEDRKAVGVYDAVEPGGSYLGEDHTSFYFKSEQYWPNLFSRLRIKDWTLAGEKSFGTRAAEYAETLLANPARSNDSGTVKAIDAALAAAEAR